MAVVCGRGDDSGEASLPKGANTIGEVALIASMHEQRHSCGRLTNAARR